MSNNRERWEENYKALYAYVLQNGHLPDKRKVDNRALLNWWKYNRKRAKLGLLDAARMEKLQKLSEMRAERIPGGLFASFPVSSVYLDEDESSRQG